MGSLPDDPRVRPGYPIDHRRPAQVAKRAQSPLGDFERDAARVVARLTGARTILQDDGSHDRMPDIRVEYSDGRLAYVEVWTDVDPGYAAVYSRLMRPKNELPLKLAEPASSRIWWVIVSGSTNVDRLEAEVGVILTRLERKGVTFERVGELASYDVPEVEQLLSHGVVRVSSRLAPADEQGTVLLLPHGISGRPSITWEPVLKWIAQATASERLKDVRRKLAATGAEERHLFLGITYSSPSDVFFALKYEERSLPHQAPGLPREISHLWLMPASSPGRCIAWFPDRGWFDVSDHWATP